MRRQIAIKAADDAQPMDKLEDKIDKVEDDFSYLLAGLSHLGSVGEFGAANELLDDLNQTIQALIGEVADAISE